MTATLIPQASHSKLDSRAGYRNRFRSEDIVRQKSDMATTRPCGRLDRIWLFSIQGKNVRNGALPLGGSSCEIVIHHGSDGKWSCESPEGHQFLPREIQEDF